MARAFTAIPIPEKQREKLEEIQEELSGKKVRPEKMHITFEFFQDLNELELEEIKTFLELLETRPFNIKIKGLGVFPSKNHIRVIWAGIESPEIQSLFEKASDHGIESDNDHEFYPHITLSRINNLKKTEKKDVHQTLYEYSNEILGSFQASELVLFESKMTSEGSKYKRLYTKEL